MENNYLKVLCFIVFVLWTLYGLFRMINDFIKYRKRTILLLKYPKGFICEGIYYSSSTFKSDKPSKDVPVVKKDELPKNYKVIMNADPFGVNID